MNGRVPELSVLIATHNRRELLRRCLEALAAQDHDPERFEVVVADDGSSDGSAAMAAAFAAPFRIRVLGLERGGQPRTLNAALAAAAGEIGLILDDDVIASRSLVSEHVRAHCEEPTIGVGKIVQQPPDSATGTPAPRPAPGTSTTRTSPAARRPGSTATAPTVRAAAARSRRSAA